MILNILTDTPYIGWTLEELFQQIKKTNLLATPKTRISTLLRELRDEKKVRRHSRKWFAILKDCD